MFVPKAPSSSADSAPNSRRRQRSGSDDSVKPPKAKRQRSVLRQDERQSHRGVRALGETQRKSQGHADPTASESSGERTSDIGGAEKQIAIRGPKEPGDQDGGLDDEAVLVRQPALSFPSAYNVPHAYILSLWKKQSRTNFYVISQLPSFPDQISGLQSGKSPPRWNGMPY